MARRVPDEHRSLRHTWERDEAGRIRIPAEMHAAIEAARRPGETPNDTLRRLLGLAESVETS